VILPVLVPMVVPMRAPMVMSVLGLGPERQRE